MNSNGELWPIYGRDHKFMAGDHNRGTATISLTADLSELLHFHAHFISIDGRRPPLQFTSSSLLPSA